MYKHTKQPASHKITQNDTLPSSHHHQHYHHLASLTYHLQWGLDGWSLPSTTGNLVPCVHLFSRCSYLLSNMLYTFLDLPTCSLPPIFTSSTSFKKLLSALFTCPNHLNILCLSLIERTSTPHISLTSILDFPTKMWQYFAVTSLSEIQQSVSGWPTNPGRPCKTLDCVPLEKYPGKSWSYNLTLKNYVLKQIFKASIFGLAVLLHFLFL